MASCLSNILRGKDVRLQVSWGLVGVHHVFYRIETWVYSNIMTAQAVASYFCKLKCRVKSGRDGQFALCGWN